MTSSAITLRDSSNERPLPFFPNEILEMIFSKNEDFDPTAPRQLFRTAVAISQVCSTWRTIALRIPEMWSSCFDYSLSDEWIAELTVRSKNMKLDITIPSLVPFLSHQWNTNRQQEFQALFANSNNNINTTPIDLLLENQHFYRAKAYPGSRKKIAADTAPFKRCHRLSLMCRDLRYWHRMYPFLETQLPELEYLALGNADRFTNPFQLMISPEADTVKPSVAWKVETLHLRYCTLPFEQPVFMSLKTLTVTALPFQHNRLTPTAWLAALENMPQLEHLALVDAMGHHDQADVRIRGLAMKGERAILPKLKTLHLKGSITKTTYILRRLDRTPECCLKLEVNIVKMDGNFNKFSGRVGGMCLGAGSDACDTVTVHFGTTNCRIVGTHSEKKFNPAIFDVGLTYSPGPAELRYPRGQRTDAFTPSAPILAILNTEKLGEVCRTASVLALGGIQLRGFPYGQLFPLFPKARRLVIDEVTWFLSVELGFLEDSQRSDTKNKENISGNDPNRRGYSTLPSLSVIQYKETQANVSELARAFRVPVELLSS